MMTDTAHAATEMATTTAEEGGPVLVHALHTVNVVMSVITEIAATATVTMDVHVTTTDETLSMTLLRSPPRMNATAGRSLCSSWLHDCAPAS